MDKNGCRVRNCRRRNVVSGDRCGRGLELRRDRKTPRGGPSFHYERRGEPASAGLRRSFAGGRERPESPFGGSTMLPGLRARVETGRNRSRRVTSLAVDRRLKDSADSRRLDPTIPSVHRRAGRVPADAAARFIAASASCCGSYLLHMGRILAVRSGQVHGNFVRMIADNQRCRERFPHASIVADMKLHPRF